MAHSPVEQLFTVFDETARIIENERSSSYLEGLAETAENIFHNELVQNDFSELTVKSLENKYKEIKIDQLDKETIRKSFQLAILKGMKQHVQAHHQMTPDGVGMFVNYLVEKLTSTCSQFSILDLAVGTGNLLTTILNGQREKDITSYGVDIDELLLRLAFSNANLQKHPIKLFNQDSLEALFIDPVDIVLADLPVGYYPNDELAKEFELCADQGHTYAHHLFIEQAYRYVKDGGYLIFIIPNNLFESEQADKLHKFIKDKLIILGLLQLPETLFKNKEMQKSIFLLQKKTAETVQPKQALLVDLPNFKNEQSLASIIKQMDEWFKENKFS